MKLAPEEKKDEWFGSYLDHDGIVADIVKRVQADSIALKYWLDPRSWQVPASLLTGGKTETAEQEPEHAGCLMWAGMAIRNFYGLWHADNPHTLTDGDHLEVKDGIVTDVRHPDNFSGKIIEQVKARLNAMVVPA